MHAKVVDLRTYKQAATLSRVAHAGENDLLIANADSDWDARDGRNELLVGRNANTDMPIFEVPRRLKSPAR